MKGFIYKYENILNNKVYIGQTTNLPNRKASHIYKSSFEVNKFYNAVRKYGWKYFKFSVLAQIEASTIEVLTELLDILEIKYIKQYDSFEHGYNSTTGGHCYRGKWVTDNFREYCRNRKYSDTTRKKMSVAAKNKIVTAKTKQKLKERAIKNNIGARLHTKEVTAKRKEAVRKALSKPILQMDKEGKVINEFQSIKEAVKYACDNLALGKTAAGIEHGIIRHCKGETKKASYYGFIWKYKTNV